MTRDADLWRRLHRIASVRQQARPGGTRLEQAQARLEEGRPDDADLDELTKKTADGRSYADALWEEIEYITWGARRHKCWPAMALAADVLLQDDLTEPWREALGRLLSLATNGYYEDANGTIQRPLPVEQGTARLCWRLLATEYASRRAAGIDLPDQDASEDHPTKFAPETANTSQTSQSNGQAHGE